MQALRNKKTGRFLVLDVRAHTYEEYGITEYVTSIRKYLELRDSDYPGVVFVTSEPGIIEDILKEGKCTYPDIRIDFDSFELSDLEVVTFDATPLITRGDDED